MKVGDIPQEMMDALRSRFESTPDVRQLRVRQGYAERRGMYDEALKIGRDIEALFVAVLHQYMEKAEREVKVLDSELDQIPRGDKDEMMEKLMVLFMACDVIDTAVMDLNDVLHRSRPGTDITTFEDIRQVSDMAKQKLKYLQETGDYMEDLVWCDRCDNMYEVMQSKARSIIRKRRDSKDWGSSARRLSGK